MHQRRVFELQGASDPWTPQDRTSSWSSKLRTKSPPCCPARGACSWAWLLLLGGSLLVPGAWSFLSEEQEEMLVELHNHFRGQVSPSASAMMPLKWDTSLKVIAEGYAAKCIWNHNPDLEETGENLFAGTGPLDLRVAVEKWFMEHLDYWFHNNSCDDEKMCGHYTQMVWADTHRIGCAFHLCNSMEGLDWERASFLVCNYFPAGNYEDERPYVEGDWCSGCPVNLQKCENNLCVPDLEEDEPEDDDTNNWTSSPPALSPRVTPAEELAEEQRTSSARPASTIKILPAGGPEDGDTPPPGTTSETDIPPGVSSSRPNGQEESEEERRESIISKEEIWERTKPVMTSAASSTINILPAGGPEDGDIPPPGTTSETDVLPGVSSPRPNGQEESEEERRESIIRKEEIWEKTKPVMTSAASTSTPPVLTGLLIGLLTLRL